MHIKKIFVAMIGLASLFTMAHVVHAAEISILAKPLTAFVGQPVRITVLLDTQDKNVNTIQAEIVFSPQQFTLQNINDGTSSVSLWIQSPKETSPGVIDLAGIMPGGFVGSDGGIFSFVLMPTISGNATIAVATSSVLENDGNGTPLPITLMNTSISIGPATGSAMPSAPSIDLIPPAAFTPEIATDTNLFGGRYFLVFNTTDNASGIDHYEVLEVPSGGSQQPFSNWHAATSPYLLTDQDLSSDIYVRAVDHNGNFVVVKVPAKNPGGYGAQKYSTSILFMILVLLLLIWICRRRMRSRPELL